MVKFNTDVDIEIGNYPSTGQPYIKLIEMETGDDFAVASVAMPDIHLSKNEVIIKDYSENIGMADELVNNNVIMKPHRVVSTEFVDFPIAIIKEEHRLASWEQ